MLQTRSQKLSQQVFIQIMPIKEGIDNEDTSNEEGRKKKTEKEKIAKEYGSLCHDFPIMVLRSGLSQAIAFLQVKSTSREAHGMLLEHLALLLNKNLGRFQTTINEAPLMQYQSYTRQILVASIWYKRFAESLLDVKAGQESSDDTDSIEEIGHESH